MKIYLNKLIAYLLTSLALALVFGPFNGNPFVQQTDNNLIGNLCRQYAVNCTKEYSLISQEFIYMKYTVGFSLLFLGLYLIRKSYTKHPGIPVNSYSIAFIADTVNILFLSFIAYCIWAVLIEAMWQETPYLYDPLSFQVISFSFIPAAVIMAFFTSNTTGQSIDIKEKGITIYSPDKSNFIYWKDIIGLNIKETFTVVGGNGIILPRKMQTKLLIKGKSKSLELFEPGYQKTKALIVKQLQTYAPDNLQNDLKLLKKEW